MEGGGYMLPFVSVALATAEKMEIADKILDIFYHQADFTTSDLQSAIQAQIHIAINFQETSNV